MKAIGASILLVNDKDEVLLLLRDDFPHIKYPNMWDIPGGNVEEGETPEECIIREMMEEMGILLTDIQLFEKRAFPDRIEHTFWKRINLDIARIELHEGQILRWFSKDEALATKLAFDFNITIEAFFNKPLYT